MKSVFKDMDVPVFLVSGGLLILFVVIGFINLNFITNLVDVSFAFSVKYFGALYQIVLLGTFLIAIVIGFSKFGKIRLGKLEKPEMNAFRWISIIMCTLLAAGGVFWAAAEPMFHFMDTPPYYTGIESGTVEAVPAALAASFVDWGFLAWAILGTLGTIVLMHVHYEKKVPLKPRALLYPIFGDKIMKNSPLGTFVDSFSIIAVAAGTIGPIGFLGLQAGFGFNSLFNIPNDMFLHVTIVVLLVLAAGVSAATGIHRGINYLSTFNVLLALFLIVAMLILGPGLFIFDSFVTSFGTYVENFLTATLYRGDQDWLSGWTVFFFAWFLGYGPMMTIFVARISRGRTIRELVTAVAIIAPVVTTFWFSVVGGTGIYQELLSPGSISDALISNGRPAAMIAITEQLPFGMIFGILFLLATIIFVLTTTDAMSLSIAIATYGHGDPPKVIRVFWALVMGAVAILLLTIGEGSINALQSFIVVTAVPVVFLMLTTFYTAPKTVMAMAEEQQIDVNKVEPVLEEKVKSN